MGRWPIACALALAAAVQCVVIAGQALPRYNTLDFSCYYVAASALRHGIDPYTHNLIPMARQMNLDVGAMVHIADTPPLLAMLAPLTLLGPGSAHAIWLLASAVLLGISLWMLLAEMGEISSAAKLSLVALALIYPPLNQVFVWGQSLAVVLFLLVVAHRSLERRPMLAGAALAAAGLLRAFPLLLVCYLVLRRRWAAFWWTAGFGALGALVTIAIVGPAVCIDWVRAIGWNTGYWQSGLAFNIGVAPFVSRLFWYAFGPHLGTITGAARQCAVVAAEIAVLFFAVRATPLNPRTADSGHRAFGVWVAAAIMLSPIAWPHLMPLLLIPFSTIAGGAMCARTYPRATIAMAVNYIAVGVWLRMWVVLDPHFYAGMPSAVAPWAIAIADMGFPILLIGFLAAYWSATAAPDALLDETRIVPASVSVPLS